MPSIQAIAEQFAHAFYQGAWREEFSEAVEKLSIAEAYAVQDAVAKLRIKRGEAVVGYKVGCTSTAIRQQFNLSEPISARLFEPYVYRGGVTLDWHNFVNCAIEPEMVLTIGHDLEGVDLSDEQLIDGIAHVNAGIELHNFKFWIGRASIQELICSGGINAGVVVGESQLSPAQLNFSSEMFSVYKDEQLITNAPAKEIMGGPIHSLRWLVGLLSRSGSCLKKGAIVIPGSPVELVSINADTDARVDIQGVGSVTAHFKKGS